MPGGDRYIHVVGWDEVQHYRTRHAPWIKSYTSLLTNPRYLRLSFRQRGLYHSICLAYHASDRDLPYSPASLRLVLGQVAVSSRSGYGQDAVRRRDIDSLVQAGFLVISASRMLEEKSREEKNREPLPLPLPVSPPDKPAVEEEKKPSRTRAPDIVWDWVVELEGEPLPRSKAGRGRVVSDLKLRLTASLNGAGDSERLAELRRRHAALSDEWGEAKATARALAEHWERAGKIADGTMRGPRRQILADDDRPLETAEQFKARAAELDALWYPNGKEIPDG